jgi:SWI/SNF-related matrix-associated actin-dependent regulator of chromatin subfamily A member 5
MVCLLQGLGKTIQTITFLAILKDKLGIRGPHLVITPLAVLQNWANEITKFAPDLTFKKIYGNRTERDYIMTNEEVLSGRFDVYLTTYEMVLAEEGFFTDCWPWATVTVDEGHKLKGDNTLLRRALSRIVCPFRLLLTGTPLQNDLHELWSLLNYILPDVFAESTSFDEGVHIGNDTLNKKTCLQARAVLENGMMLRRLKVDVETILLPKLYRKIYVGMTDLQKKWYRSVLTGGRDGDSEGADGAPLSFNELWMIVAQLQKVVNHPKQLYDAREKRRRLEYGRVEKARAEGAEFCLLPPQFERPAPGSAAYCAERELSTLSEISLIKSSGKLAMLDRLLLGLKQKGSRVLLFSQYTQTLDVLQDYLTFRFGPIGKCFLRLDGQTARINRELDVRSFNSPGSEIFLYLISTKAGGVGINLATADSVVMYEPCWNPQVDLQAEDRAHRIGQRRQVTVYKIVTQDSFEQRVQAVAEKRLMLDHMVIAKNRAVEEDIKSPSSNGQSTATPNRRSGRSSNNIFSSSSSSITTTPVNKAKQPAPSADTATKVSMTELWKTLRHGTDRIFNSVGGGGGEGGGGGVEVLLDDAALDRFIATTILNSTEITAAATASATTTTATAIDFSSAADAVGDGALQPDSEAADPTSGRFGIKGVRTIFDLAQAGELGEEEVAVDEGLGEGEGGSAVASNPTGRPAPSGGVSGGAAAAFAAAAQHQHQHILLATTTANAANAARVAGAVAGVVDGDAEVEPEDAGERRKRARAEPKR